MRPWRHQPSNQDGEEILDTNLVKKYVAYAKRNVQPEPTKEAGEMLVPTTWKRGSRAVLAPTASPSRRVPSRAFRGSPKPALAFACRTPLKWRMQSERFG